MNVDLCTFRAISEVSEFTGHLDMVRIRCGDGDGDTARETDSEREREEDQYYGLPGCRT